MKTKQRFGAVDAKAVSVRWFDVRADRDLYVSAAREAGLPLIPVNSARVAA